MRQQIQFLKHFFRNPNKVGAITALNNHVGKELVKYIRQSPKNRPIKILEAGAGYGNISEIILQNLNDEDTFDIIEVDKKCCVHLERKFSNNKNVKVHATSILNWTPNYQYDFIISTLPFNSYPIEFVKGVIDRYKNISSKEAICSYVEYSGLIKIRKTFAQKENRTMMMARQEILHAFQKKYLIDKHRVINNFPPCNVYHLKMTE